MAIITLYHPTGQTMQIDENASGYYLQNFNWSKTPITPAQKQVLQPASQPIPQPAPQPIPQPIQQPVYNPPSPTANPMQRFVAQQVATGATPSGYQEPAQSPVQEQPQQMQVDTGDAMLNELLKTTQAYLDELTKRGQTINPNVEITPEQTARFLTQAQGEISPYYANQMKLARENLLREAGYTTDEIAANEREVERKYGQSLRTLGEGMAETGFALSGRRLEGEQNLAQDTQASIDQARKAAEYSAGSSARQFASEWGGAELPSYSYGQAPRVLAGTGTFQRTGETKPFYSISDSVLSGLTGSRQWEQQTAEKQRASELEQLERTILANKQRSLNL